MAINVDDISEEIARALKEYTEEVEEGIDVASTKVSKEAVKELKKTSPKKSGDYRKGWRVKSVNGKKVIHNKTDYQLTHLLENGHAKAGGGRVKAIPHIKPVEERAIRDFEEEVKKVIKG